MSCPKKLLLFLLCYTHTLMAQQATTFLVGYGKTDLTYVEDELGLFGYGEYKQRITKDDGFTSRIYARTIAITDPNTSKQLIYVHADLGAIFHSLRRALLQKIQQNIDPNFEPSALFLSASHTHCAPAGMSQYAIYMMSAPGYNPDLVEFTVTKLYESIVQALAAQKSSTIELKEGVFEPETMVAFNRALKAFNKNKDIERKFKCHESHLALNRNMPLLSFKDTSGVEQGFINWFGVHPIEMLQDHNHIDGASKGYAATYAEEQLPEGSVAIFAQGAAGDVMTTDFHNAEIFEEKMREVLQDSSYHHLKSSLKHAEWNGQLQANKALAIRSAKDAQPISGTIDHELVYIDMSSILVDAEFSNKKKKARTTSAVLGSPFLTGKFYWKDHSWIRAGLNTIAGFSKLSFYLRSPFMKKEKRQYRKELYRYQSPKRIVIDGTEKSLFGMKLEDYNEKGFPRFFFKKIAPIDPTIAEIFRQAELGALREHTVLPTIVPIQLVRIGNIAIAGIPTEITTIAHNRLQKTLLDVLKEGGIEQVFITSYANDYAGYTTTYEEYKAQRYEGGHTLFGKHQLGAFQTEFKKLATELLKEKSDRILDRKLRPPVFSEEELSKRSNLKPLQPRGE